MAERLALQSKLELEIIESGVSGVVYFQPPEDVRMVYPCVVYHRDSASYSHADNNPYRFEQRYELTVIDRASDSPIVDRIKMLPKTFYVRGFESDGLHHDIFNIYF